MLNIISKWETLQILGAIAGLVVILLDLGLAANASPETDAVVPAWLVAGPFELQNVGFGDIEDKGLIDEANIEPYPGKAESSTLTRDGQVIWKLHAADARGYVDFNTALGWELPGREVEKIWWGKAGFAATYIESPEDQEVHLLVGSNSRMKVFLNHQPVYTHWSERAAVADDDTLVLQLRKGRNLLLVEVTNSHNNLVGDWFGGTPLGWGFFARWADASFQPLQNIRCAIPDAGDVLEFELVSTFFFKENSDGLQQRLDLVVTSSGSFESPAEFALTIRKQKHSFTLDSVPAGISRHEVYIPELDRDSEAACELVAGEQKIDKKIILKKQRHYKLYLGLLTHMDIGYTNTQPVVMERHVQTLDDVLDLCAKDPEFKWTVETTWCLEQYQKSRPADKFERLMALVRSGRVTVSPMYSNPSTGWISYEEMIRSFELAKSYAREYGLTYKAAIVNDLPGLSWVIPQVLNKVGVSFLVCGINEIYGGYLLQENLPKVFYWEGADKSRLLTYVTEAYSEGRSYGLEKGLEGTVSAVWHNLNRLEARDYPYDLVYLNADLCDNCGIPEAQFEAAQEWNRVYAYPKIVVSTLSEFAGDFTQKYKENVPVLRGDWTSAWDIQYQSEPELFIRQREIQHKLVAAENVISLNWLLDPQNYPQEALLTDAYRSLLSFAGHGSGLEFSYGSAEENFWAVAYREGNIRSAGLQAEEALERGMYRFAVPQFSFESQGVMVFNSLAWSRDAAVEFFLPMVDQTRYAVVNMADGREVPSYQERDRIIFIVRALPSLGYRKYKLVQRTGTETAIAGELQKTGNSIENQFYRITFDPISGEIGQIVDKKTKRVIVQSETGKIFNQLRCDRGFGANVEFPVATSPRVAIKDESPVRLILESSRPGFLLDKVEYSLWNGLDRVDIEFSLDVSRLAATDVIEEYGIAFPFTLDDPAIRVEQIGGYLDPAQDCLPGKQNTAFSIRRSVALSDAQSTLSWATLDSRVVSLKKTGDDASPVLYSNFINNFPRGWNRNQIEDGRLTSRFSISNQATGFLPGFTARFGWEAATKPIALRWPLSAEAPEKSFVSVDNEDVVLLAMKTDVKKGRLILDFLNVNPEKTVTITVRSELLADKASFTADLLDRKINKVKKKNGEFRLTLSPNEILPVIFMSNEER